MSESLIEAISDRLDHLERENRRLRVVGRRWKLAAAGIALAAALGLLVSQGVGKARAQSGSPFDARDSWKPLKIGGMYINRFLMTHVRISEGAGGNRALQVSFAGTEPPLRLTGQDAEAMVWWLDGIALELTGPPKEAPVPKGR